LVFSYDLSFAKQSVLLFLEFTRLRKIAPACQGKQLANSVGCRDNWPAVKKKARCRVVTSGCGTKLEVTIFAVNHVFV
jgi:hypothetical protein